MRNNRNISYILHNLYFFSVFSKTGAKLLIFCEMGKYLSKKLCIIQLFINKDRMSNRSM